ncbi:MAG: hypothetical protein FJX76_06175 [Armatimonadetes bacterium]|nr:hypothetical protein [Armatimonadota bacterium]
MRRALIALTILLAVARPCAAAPAHSHEEDMAPIQMYYHKNFFGEPWRQPGYYRIVLRQTVYVLGAALVVFGLLRARRRRA